jgi:hypothetical protein
MPVDVRKLHQDRAKFVRSLGPDPDAEAARIVKEAADLMFERFFTAGRAPLWGDRETSRQMFEIATFNGAACLGLVPDPCDECQNRLIACKTPYRAQRAVAQIARAAGATLSSSATSSLNGGCNG